VLLEAIIRYVHSTVTCRCLTHRHILIYLNCAHTSNDELIFFDEWSVNIVFLHFKCRLTLFNKIKMDDDLEPKAKLPKVAKVSMAKLRK